MARARYRARHKAQGLCLECPRPALPGKTLCGYHAMKGSMQNRLYRQRHYLKIKECEIKNRQYSKDNHLCIYCGAPFKEDWETLSCPNCSTETRFSPKPIEVE